jgi:hypothetical protein
MKQRTVYTVLYTPGTLIIYNRTLGSALHRYLLCDLMQENIRKKAKSEQRNSLPCTNIMKETPRRITVTSSLKVHKRENFLGFDFEICTFS